MSISDIVSGGALRLLYANVFFNVATVGCNMLSVFMSIVPEGQQTAAPPVPPDAGKYKMDVHDFLRYSFY